MRSRDGAHPLLLLLCAVSLLSALRADEYIISYRAVTQDALLLNESLSVSRAMRPCTGAAGRSLTLPRAPGATLKQILDAEFETFFAHLQSLPLRVTHRESVERQQSRSVTILELPPRCFTVEFNDDFVKIAPLRERNIR